MNFGSGCGNVFNRIIQTKDRFCHIEGRMNEKNKIMYQDEGTTIFSIISRKNETFFITIDTEDVDKIKHLKWNVAYKKNGSLHAVRAAPKFKQKMVYIHNLITGNNFTDHKDGHILNNKKSNLRGCSQKENNRNVKTHKDNKTGYKGVGELKNRYRARITVNGKTISIGSFETKEEAAIAYNNNAKFYFGEFARLNKI